MQSLIAHIDMDCFFCSCELKRYPELEGTPVIVGSTTTRGVVSAANYEAREYGIYSATPIGRAHGLCPHATYLPVDRSFYAEESAQVMQYIASLADSIQQVSIDEAYLQLDTLVTRYEGIEEMARDLQHQIYERFNLPCSIGVAPSKRVAKIASDYQKPHGITVVTDIPAFLAPLSIKKMPGIGNKSAHHYAQHGIHTIGDLASMERFRVIELFGMQGVAFQDVASGRDDSTLQEPEPHKSVSRARTLQQDTRDSVVLHNALEHLCERVSADLEEEFFRTITIKVRYSDFTTVTRDLTLKTPTHSLDQMLRYARMLLKREYEKSEKGIRLVGVRVSGLTGRGERQLTLGRFCPDVS